MLAFAFATLTIGQTVKPAVKPTANDIVAQMNRQWDEQLLELKSAREEKVTKPAARKARDQKAKAIEDRLAKLETDPIKLLELPQADLAKPGAVGIPIPPQRTDNPKATARCKILAHRQDQDGGVIVVWMNAKTPAADDTRFALVGHQADEQPDGGTFAIDFPVYHAGTLDTGGRTIPVLRPLSVAPAVAKWKSEHTPVPKGKKGR